MSIEDVISKISGMEGVSAEEIATLKSVVAKDEYEAAMRKAGESDAKAARILDEKKKAQAKADELALEIENIKSGGLSEVEKMQKELKQATDAREAALKDAGEAQAKLQSSIRSTQLDKIANGIKFLDAIPWDMRVQSVHSALAEIDDLSSEAEVTAAMAKFKETHKGVLASESAPTGSGSEGKAAPKQKSKDPNDMSDEERAKHLREKHIA